MTNESGLDYKCDACGADELLPSQCVSVVVNRSKWLGDGRSSMEVQFETAPVGDHHLCGPCARKMHEGDKAPMQKILDVMPYTAPPAEA